MFKKTAPWRCALGEAARGRKNAMNGKRIFALKGNLIYTKEIGTMEIAMQHYLVCEDGKVEESTQLSRKNSGKYQ